MNEARPRIGIVVGTTREGRFADIPARWLVDLASARGDLAIEVVDLRDHPLPFYGEPGGPGAALAVRRWRDALAAPDAYLFLVAEYNHSVSGVLKNALDHAPGEVGRKPAAFVGYGCAGGARAVEQLRLVCAELGMAPLGAAVHIGGEGFRSASRGAASLGALPHLEAAATAMLDELAWWAEALRLARSAGIPEPTGR